MKYYCFISCCFVDLTEQTNWSSVFIFLFLSFVRFWSCRFWLLAFVFDFRTISPILMSGWHAAAAHFVYLINWRKRFQWLILFGSGNFRKQFMDDCYRASLKNTAIYLFVYSKQCFQVFSPFGLKTVARTRSRSLCFSSPLQMAMILITVFSRLFCMARSASDPIHVYGWLLHNAAAAVSNSIGWGDEVLIYVLDCVRLNLEFLMNDNM